MSLTHDLKRGMVIRHNGQLFSVLDFVIAHSGKQRPTAHVKLRSIQHGNLVDRTLDQLGKIDEVTTEHRTMQFLYSTGDQRVFMDTESFDEQTLAPQVFGQGADFLVEGQAYRFLVVDAQVLSLDLPPVIALEVVETAPVEHGGGNSSVYKDAKLASGITISVPMFIKTGERVKVRTDTREYQGKEH